MVVGVEVVVVVVSCPMIGSCTHTIQYDNAINIDTHTTLLSLFFVSFLSFPPFHHRNMSGEGEGRDGGQEGGYGPADDASRPAPLPTDQSHQTYAYSRGRISRLVATNLLVGHPATDDELVSQSERA